MLPNQRPELLEVHWKVLKTPRRLLTIREPHGLEILPRALMRLLPRNCR
ncbi:hypothetical protein OSTOST_18042, partial [Ostertagia ostertagi]